MYEQKRVHIETGAIVTINPSAYALESAILIANGTIFCSFKNYQEVYEKLTRPLTILEKALREL
jgi:hypothetical protein